MKKIINIFIITFVMLCIGGCKEQKTIIHIISDVHYAPREYFDYTGKFAINCDTNGSGKQIKYQEEILDAFINEEIENKPDYLLITGDLVISGTKEAHEAFANRLHRLIDNGIKVIILPGNHDLDSTPFIYEDEQIVYQESLSPDEFANIYKEYGYGSSYNKDANSLSYSYKLDNNNFLIVLDTIEKYGSVYGLIKEDTIEWIKTQLDYANKEKLNIIMCGHHNIFTHNELFDDYRIYNSNKLISIMKEYNVHIFLSGHMHIQDIQSEKDITEILNESFSIYPHRYGELVINGSNYSYISKETNINKYSTSNEEDIINYDEYGYDFLFNNFCAKSLGKNNPADIGDDEMLKIKLNTKLNVKYFMGINDDLEEYKKIYGDSGETKSSYIDSVIKHLNENNLDINGKLR